MNKLYIPMNTILLICIAFSSFGCNCTSENHSNEVIDENISQVKEITLGYNNLKFISELKKACKPYSDNDLFENANNWSFSIESVSNLLKHMRKVESNEWYALCTIYPCWYEGKVANEKVNYEILINAGGFVILTNEDETLHFILEDKSSLFIAVCDCCE